MLNRIKKVTTIAVLSVITVFSYATPTFALTSDLQYTFITENKDEFYNRGESHLNFNGLIPDFLHDIYDFTPQLVYDSQYGSNIIINLEPSQTPLTNAPYYAPVGNYMAAPTQTTGALQGNGAEGHSGAMPTNAATPAYSTTAGPMLPNNDWFESPGSNMPSYPNYGNSNEAMQYPLTPIEEVRNSNGSIGTLSIPKIGVNVTAYDGDTYAAMKKGIGHISSTSSWSSNIGLIGHNRGPNDYFGKLKNLKPGDEMSYSTKLGTRAYVVQEVTRISETDWSRLQYTSDNRLTLLTCVEDVPSQRLVVVAVEKR